jgi:spermidine synthase
MSLPWQTLATVATKDGPLELRRRGERDFHITIAGRILMTSTAHLSEVALARLGCAGLRDKAGARVLVSGLGMGFTLRAALDELGPDARVVVAELTPEVVEWCRGPLAPLTGGAVSDPRVEVHVESVTTMLRELAGNPRAPRFDAIVLDLYLGPDARIAPNDPLYGPGATARVRECLVPGGTYAVWGENSSPDFERQLARQQLEWTLHRAGRRGGRSHFVYAASRRG